MARLPVGIRFIVSFSRDQWYRAFIFILTFLLYASFHLSRKPISIVKGELHRYCAAVNEGEVEFNSQNQKAGDVPPHQRPDNETDCGWAPFDRDNYQQLLGALDYSFLCAYAIGMYLSGIIGERLPIRYYLTFGMLASGAFTALFGLGYFYNIHSFGFYVVTQIVNGLVQTTGWPSVVTCLSNWFGKGRRGLIMGVWNSHTSVGNILGSLIAGYWVSTCWGLSFVVPGAIVAAMGIVCFLFLIEHPRDIACSSTLTAHSKGYENGMHRLRLQKHVLMEKNKPLDPEMQCLLLSDGKHSAHQNHTIVLPADAGSGVAAISFTGALKIPGVIEFSLCLLFAKLVSYTFLFWLPLYITNVAVHILHHQQNGSRSHHRHAAAQRGPGQRAIRTDHDRRLCRPGHPQKPERKLPRPRHCDGHHRRHRLCRSSPGPPAGRAPLPVGMEQRVLHVDVCGRLCLTVPDPPHTQGAELPAVCNGEPSSV
ncbi:glucose-6-phosphate exchanger SLC37A1 isoform X2 [Equus caballus]|uniref:glucose-6-phosphate exchanger SLC37A1 isoform X2 n=1 Tax=Equus caballus TaxID=9796 RepID=UPI000717BCBA|nr:glucose-6-phosphate exchanger SLC37A1 isoform X2 [Equus caballus]